jgi:hypothetical protein
MGVCLVVGVYYPTFSTSANLHAVCCIGYDYFQLFPRDRPVFKLLVTLALLMCLVDTVADGWVDYRGRFRLSLMVLL